MDSPDTTPTTELLALSRETARRTVQAWRQRLRDFSLHSNYAYRPDQFLPTCDTITVAVPPPCPAFVEPNEPAAPLLALREALEIWHTVSCCRGFAFHENPSFWEDALGITFSCKLLKSRLAVTVPFPVVVIHWDPHGEREQVNTPNKTRELAFHLEAFFGMIGPQSTTRSTAYHQSMCDVWHFDQLTRASATAIRVKLRFGVAKSSLHAESFMAWLPGQIQRIHSHASQPQRLTSPVPLQLAGLQLVLQGPLRHPDWKWLYQSLRDLPDDLATEFPYHAIYSPKVMARSEASPFFLEAIGGVSTCNGRLEVLDLRCSGKGAVDFNVVCSLLPRSRSIREVRIDVEKPLDLLWLLYAMFHPLSQKTRWNHLCLTLRHTYAIDLMLMRWFLRSRNGAEVIQRVASTPMEEWNDLWTAFEVCKLSSQGCYVVQSAILLKRSKVFRVSQTGSCRSALTTLAHETEVELCEQFVDKLPAFVHVIIPGLGLCGVYRDRLTRITEQTFSGFRVSCITALHLLDHNSSDATAAKFLRKASHSLGHVRISKPLALFNGSKSSDNTGESIEDFEFTNQAQDVLLESIDGLQFSVELIPWMQRLPRLHSFGVSCTADQLDELHLALKLAFTDKSLRRQTALRALRIDIDEINASDDAWKPSLGALVTTLTTKFKTVRVLEIAVRKHYYRLQTLDLEEVRSLLPTSQPGLAIRKLAFLGVLSSWLPDKFALDSYLIGYIFSYCGPSIERAVIQENYHGNCLMLEPSDEVV